MVNLTEVDYIGMFFMWMAVVTLGIGMPYVFFTTAWEDGTLHR